MNVKYRSLPEDFLGQMQNKKSPFAPELSSPGPNAADLIKFRKESVSNRISKNVIATMLGDPVPVKQEEIKVTLPDKEPEKQKQDTVEKTTKQTLSSKKKVRTGAEAFNSHHAAEIDGFNELLQAAILEMAPQEIRNVTGLSDDILEKCLWSTNYRVRDSIITKLAKLPDITVEDLKSELENRARYKNRIQQAKWRERQKALVVQDKNACKEVKDNTETNMADRKDEGDPTMQMKEDRSSAMMAEAEEAKAKYTEGGIVLSLEKTFKTEKELLEYCKEFGISEVKFSLI